MLVLLNTLDSTDIALVILGAAIGFILGLIGTVIILILQFSRSIAAYRVNGVAQATEKIRSANANGEYSGVLIDRYRFSLGVIIDEFTKPCFAKTFAEGRVEDTDLWPCLVDFNPQKTSGAEKVYELDRWGRFLRNVRPVMDDINDFALLTIVADHLLSPYLFLDVFPKSSPLLRLQRLGQLCQKIETTVGLLDGAFEKNMVELTSDNHIKAIEFDSVRGEVPSKLEFEGHKAELSNAYQELSCAWVAWEEVAAPRSQRDVTPKS